MAKKGKAVISDSKLIEAIETYGDADKICDETGISLNTLQRRVAILTHKNKKVYEIEGLYKPESPYVKMNKPGIIISQKRLMESNFEVGDEFKVEWTRNKITLTKV